MKTSDWAGIIAALGLGSVGFWFWRKGSQAASQAATKVALQSTPKSTPSPKVVGTATKDASALTAALTAGMVKKATDAGSGGKLTVVKPAKLSDDVLKRLLQNAVRDEKHTGTLGAVVQWGTIIAVIQEQMREASFGSTWAKGVLEFASEARAATTPDKDGIATFIRDTGWTTSLRDDIDGWPLAPGPAGRCAFPMVGSDIDRIGSTPLLTADGYIPDGDGWKMLAGPFEARQPIRDAMTTKCLFKEGNIVNEKMDSEDVSVKIADTAWGKSFRYNKYKDHKDYIGLAMPKPPADCKTKAQLEHWILSNGGFTAKTLGEYSAKVFSDPKWWTKNKSPVPLWTQSDIYNRLSPKWRDWYDRYGKAIRVSRNLIQAAESWRVTAYQQQLLKTIKWDTKFGGKDANLVYDVAKSLKPSTPSWWVDHCLAWGCGCATDNRMRTHWTPALGFKWYEGKKSGGWKTAPPVYPDPRTDVNDLLKYIMKLTPPPGSKWHKHSEPLGRTVDTSGWVAWNWPKTTGSLYPNYRQTRATLEATQKRYQEWRDQEFPPPMSDREKRLRAFRMVSEAISTLVSVYAGGVSAITMTMTNMIVEGATEILSSAFGGNKVVGTLLGIAHAVAGYATNQSWDADPAGMLKEALYQAEKGRDPKQLLENAVSQISNWKEVDGWEYGSDLIGKFTDVPKKYRDVLKGM